MQINRKPPFRELHRLPGWLPHLDLARRGSIAIVDQAVLSLSSFLVSVLLARFMDPGGYGAFSFAFSIFLLISGLFEALLFEPMVIFGVKRFSQQFKSYLNQILVLHLAISVITGALLCAFSVLIAKAFSNMAISPALSGLGLSLGFILGQWMIRRACYVRNLPGLALIGTILYGISVLAAVAFLKYTGYLTPFSVFIFIGVSSITPFLLLSRFLRQDSDEPLDSGRLYLRSVWIYHWEFGRWILLASVLFWISGPFYYVLSAGFLTLTDVAALRAIQNLTIPLTQVSVAWGFLFVPWASRTYQNGGIGPLRRAMWSFTVLMLIIGLFYGTTMIVLGKPIVHGLYGGSYDSSRSILGYLLCVAVTLVCVSAWRNGLKIIERTRALMIVDSVSAVFTLTIGVWLVRTMGLFGAALGMLGGAAIQIPLLALMWYRYSKAEQCFTRKEGEE